MTETELVLAVPAALLAVATIVAKSRGARRLVLVVKPLTMAAIVAMFAVESGSATHGVAWWLVGAGLVASTIGDVLLETEKDRFVAGLVSFLVAHVCYLVAFATRAIGAERGVPWVAACVALGALVGYAVVVLRALDAGLGEFRVPVRAYVGVIVVMAWAAVAWWLADRSAEAELAVGGAVCFFVSDTLLAIDRFRAKLPYSHALILGTYFVAQFLIAASAR